MSRSLRSPKIRLAIRWKFLLVMIAIAIVPLLISAWLEIRSVSKLGAEIAAESGRTINERSRQSLQRSLHQLVESLNREASTVELLARLHAEKAVQALSKGAANLMPAPEINWAHEFNDDSATDHYSISDSEQLLAITRDNPTLFVAQNTKPQDILNSAQQLSTLSDFYQLIDRSHSGLYHWQYVALENGLIATFPGHGKYPSEFDARQRAWYETQKSRRELLWSPLHTDVSTGIAMINITMPLISSNGEFLGVSGMDLRLSGLLSALQVPIKFEYDSKIILSAVGAADESGEENIFIIAESDNYQRNQHWRDKPTPQTLTFDEPDHSASLVKEILAGRRGNIRARWQGEDYLCLYEPLQANRSALMMFVPIQNLLNPALQSAQHTLVSTKRYVRSLLPFAALIVAIIVLLAFIGSRRFVRPIKDLVEAVNSVADGDFSTRVKVKTGDEFEQLGNAFNQLIPQLEEHTRVTQDLTVARAVQQRLLPDAAPDFPGIEITGHTLYADQTGGDYYDFIDLPEHETRRLGIVLGDVAGHGIASALMMASVRALLHGTAQASQSPSAVLRHINENLADDLHAGQFMTLFYLIFDPKRHTILWADAGHDPAIIYRPDDDSFSELSGGDIPLGVDSDWQYENDHLHQMKTNELFMLGTDGIWETKSPNGELFGKGRLRAILRQHHAKPVSEICDEILSAIDSFRGHLDQRDDVSIVIFRLNTAPQIGR